MSVNAGADLTNARPPRRESSAHSRPRSGRRGEIPEESDALPGKARPGLSLAPSLSTEAFQEFQRVRRSRSASIASASRLGRAHAKIEEAAAPVTTMFTLASPPLSTAMEPFPQPQEKPAVRASAAPPLAVKQKSDENRLLPLLSFVLTLAITGVISSYFLPFALQDSVSGIIMRVISYQFTYGLPTLFILMLPWYTGYPQIVGLRRSLVNKVIYGSIFLLSVAIPLVREVMWPWSMDEYGITNSVFDEDYLRAQSRSLYVISSLQCLLHILLFALIPLIHRSAVGKELAQLLGRTSMTGLHQISNGRWKTRALEATSWIIVGVLVTMPLLELAGLNFLSTGLIVFVVPVTFFAWMDRHRSPYLEHAYMLTLMLMQMVVIPVGAAVVHLIAASDRDSFVFQVGLWLLYSVTMNGMSGPPHLALTGHA